ncbi:MAG: hypothetical protein ABGY24_06920 [bacterium]
MADRGGDDGRGETRETAAMARCVARHVASAKGGGQQRHASSRRATKVA